MGGQPRGEKFREDPCIGHSVLLDLKNFQQLGVGDACFPEFPSDFSDRRVQFFVQCSRVFQRVLLGGQTDFATQPTEFEPRGGVVGAGKEFVLNGGQFFTRRPR